MVELGEYLAVRERPAGSPAMYQEWRDLTFLHFSADPAEIQPMLPAGLTVDTYPDEQGVERAWVGLVPFRMQQVRPYTMPAVPGCHAFPETNVRTYVHREGKKPGVWFFSLDAANPAACVYARRRFSLPYFPASMKVFRDADEAWYESVRWGKIRHRVDGPVDRSAVVNIEIKLGAELALPEPGSLEFFLAERYLLYAERHGQLFTGQVNHVPYLLLQAQIVRAAESMIYATGIAERAWEHVLFSPGVDVDVFAIELAD